MNIKNTIGFLSLKSMLVLLLVTISTMSIAQSEPISVDDAKGLLVGDRVEDFSAKGLLGDNFILSEALKSGPVVVVFYRGQWCPVCNRHLSALQDSLELITKKGATLVAVSPEKPEHLSETSEKTGASFTLLYDEGYEIASLFDVLFLPKSATTSKYNTFLAADLKNAHSDGSQQLPIPATFIIGVDNTVLWRQFDPNYKYRSSVVEIIDNLP